MAIDQLNIEDKEDSPDKLAAVQGIPTKYVVFASIINLIRNKINQLVAFCNMLKNDLLNPSDKTFPTTIAVVSALLGKLNKPATPEADAAVILHPDNTTSSMTFKQFDIFDDIAIAYATINELVTVGNYSQANGFTKGMRVICGSSTPPVIWHKYDNTDTAWIRVVAEHPPLN